MHALVEDVGWLHVAMDNAALCVQNAQRLCELQGVLNNTRAAEWVPILACVLDELVKLAIVQTHE